MTTHTSAPDGDVLTMTYVSSATRLLSVQQLVELIDQIRPKNERLGVTGLLLYSGGNVIQTLEGTAAAVESVFGALEVDPRHADVRVVERRHVAERAFSTWSMGFRNVSDREIADRETFAEFVRRSSGQDLGAHATSAYDLLERFRVNAV